ncbi:hypothetical protein C5S53_04790 [Methanophagales archaeon]|nr:hypothetical protein C5S53_04790 [Methanophagales archaeon]
MYRRKRKVTDNTLAALKYRRGYKRMKNKIVLRVRGTAPDFAVCFEYMGQSVTSLKEERKL